MQVLATQKGRSVPDVSPRFKILYTRIRKPSKTAAWSANIKIWWEVGWKKDRKLQTEDSQHKLSCLKTESSHIFSIHNFTICVVPRGVPENVVVACCVFGVLTTGKRRYGPDTSGSTSFSVEGFFINIIKLRDTAKAVFI